jgi:23S rRNA (adenine2503-C2)-methyltransferase
MASWGEPQFRATQLLRWLYSRQAVDYQEMTDLPRVLRERLEAAEPFAAPQVLERRVSADGSRKFLLRLADGASVETVGIPSEGGRAPGAKAGGGLAGSAGAKADSGPAGSAGAKADDNLAGGRLTVCFSTQVGCAMGCAFCATGTRGLQRSLWPGEMVDQLLVVSRDFGQRVTNAVAMGEGEPFANYDATLAALRIMNSPDGMAIGARRLTVSSCGLLGPLKRFMREPEQFTLAISLHSAIQRTRDMLMPTLASQTLDRLRSTLTLYAEATGRRPSLEFTLIDGVNDTTREIDALIAFARGMLCHVNLIPLNTAGSFAPSPPDRIAAIVARLHKTDIECSLRRSRGADIAGACGQLKG